jgi:hypothetical protein
MGSYIYPYNRGVYPLFFRGWYMKSARFHIIVASTYIVEPSTHYFDAPFI